MKHVIAKVRTHQAARRRRIELQTQEDVAALLAGYRDPHRPMWTARENEEEES